MQIKASPKPISTKLLGAAAAALLAAALAPAAASAARYGCSSQQQALIGYPLGYLPVPTDTGANCTVDFYPGVQILSGSVSVSGVGVVSGRLDVSMSGPGTSMTCGPAVNTCAIEVPALGGRAATATCSLTGVVAISTYVRCSFETA